MSPHITGNDTIILPSWVLCKDKAGEKNHSGRAVVVAVSSFSKRKIKPCIGINFSKRLLFFPFPFLIYLARSQKKPVNSTPHTFDLYPHLTRPAALPES